MISLWTDHFLNLFINEVGTKSGLLMKFDNAKFEGIINTEEDQDISKNRTQ